MSAPSQSRHRLRIEALETRTLLAADAADPFGLAGDLYAAMLAVDGTGSFQGIFNTNFGNQRLVLTGTKDATLTIDLDVLPNFITNLSISSFESVKLIGTDRVNILTLKDIGTFTADNLTVDTRVDANEVESITLGHVSDLLTLTGTQTKLDVESLNGATINSYLRSLTLSTETANPSLISLNAEQELYLQGFTPGTYSFPGLPNSSIYVLAPGAEAPDISNPGTTPTDPTDPTKPTEPGPTSPTESGQLIIVSFPLDERTRVFLLELRAALNSSSGNVDRLIAEFIGEQKQSPVANAGPLALNQADRFAELDSALHEHLSLFGPAAEAPPLAQVSTTVLADEFLAASAGPSSIAPFADNIRPAFTPEPTLSLPVGAPTADDIAWDASAVSVDPATVRSALEGTDSVGAGELALADSVRAFGNYVVERLTAEFSPGQQSLVLLVDPQPSRPASLARKSADDAIEPSATLAVGSLNQI